MAGLPNRVDFVMETRNGMEFPLRALTIAPTSRALFAGMPEDPTTPNEVVLLRRIAEGDQQAFSQFYDQFSGVLFSLAVRILNDPKEAEDVLQEVFLQIWGKASIFDSRMGKPLGWVMTLARHKAIDRLRASQRRHRLMEEATAEFQPLANGRAHAPEKMQADEKAARVRSVLTALPMEQRQAIELAFFGGLTQIEISEKLKQPLGTIKARIRRGMLKLREMLDEEL